MYARWACDGHFVGYIKLSRWHIVHAPDKALANMRNDEPSSHLLTQNAKGCLLLPCNRIVRQVRRQRPFFCMLHNNSSFGRIRVCGTKSCSCRIHTTFDRAFRNTQPIRNLLLRQSFLIKQAKHQPILLRQAVQRLIHSRVHRCGLRLIWQGIHKHRSVLRLCTIPIRAFPSCNANPREEECIALQACKAPECGKARLLQHILRVCTISDMRLDPSLHRCFAGCKQRFKLIHGRTLLPLRLKTGFHL